MIWLRRSLVLVPVVAFLGAALLLSCGGGSSSTPGAGLPFSLMSLSICAGPPPTAMPTVAPTKTTGPTPSATPTPQCTPTAEADPIPTLGAPGNTTQFNVQGTFQKSSTGRKLFFDQTSNLSLRWNIAPEVPPGDITTGNVPGQFVAVAPGCVCLTAQIAPFVSCPVSVTVATSVPCPPCPTPTSSPLCPGPTPTVTPTHTPKAAFTE